MNNDEKERIIEELKLKALLVPCGIADSLWEEALALVKELQTENTALRERLEGAVELPFFQKDGECIIIIYKEEHRLVCIEEYFEDEFYDGMRGSEVAEARFAELKEGRRDAE